MSIITSTPQQIRNAPTNTSPAKMQYSFAKCRRFLYPKDDGSTFFYNIKAALDQRATGIGFGQKSDFTKERGRDVPPPNQYEIQSDFKQGYGPKYSFGVSREACAKRALEGNPQPDPVIPGPGTYNVLKPTGSQQSKWTMRSRSTTGIFATSKNPGPGQYSPKPALDERGVYNLSKFKNSGACTFSPKSLPRFQYARGNMSPGPGQYEYPLQMNNTGNYFASNVKSTGARKFPNSKRVTMPSTASTPGPGSYRLPSEFGHYENRNKEVFLKEMEKKAIRTQSLPKLVSSSRG